MNKVKTTTKAGYYSNLRETPREMRFFEPENQNNRAQHPKTVDLSTPPIRYQLITRGEEHLLFLLYFFR